MTPNALRAEPKDALVTETLDFSSTPDLRRLFAAAVVRRRPKAGPAAALPDVVAREDGIRVDVDRLVRYAEICGFPVTGTLPVTYPYVVGFPLQIAVMARPDFPFAVMGLVHIENTITWTGPLRASDLLDVSVRPSGLRGHRRGQLFDLVTSVSVGGRPVWDAVSTYLARGAGDPQAPASPGPDVTDVDTGTVPVHVPGDIGRQYAAVSRDPNPIHLSGVTARLFGFKTAIAHGMWTYARVLAALGPQLAPAGTSTVWFRKPVPVGRPARLSMTPDGRLAVLRPASGQGEHLVALQVPEPAEPH